MDKSICWDYMIACLNSEISEESAEDVGLFLAYTVGDVKPGVVHTKLTKTINN